MQKFEEYAGACVCTQPMSDVFIFALCSWCVGLCCLYQFRSPKYVGLSSDKIKNICKERRLFWSKKKRCFILWEGKCRSMCQHSFITTHVFLPDASFGLQALSLPHHPFKRGSTNLDQSCKTPQLRSHLFRGQLILAFRTTFNLQATVLDARASRVEWPAQFMSHWYGILFTE